MKKLKLNLDDLKVESFETNEKEKENKGSAFANVTWTQIDDFCSMECRTEGEYTCGTCNRYCPIEP